MGHHAAASVLLEIDFYYFMLWGQVRLAAELHELLQGRIGDRGLLRASLNNLDLCYRSLGDDPRTIEHCEQSLAVGREIGAAYSQAIALTNLGDLYRDTGNGARANRYRQEAVGLADATGNAKNGTEAPLGPVLGDLFAGDLVVAQGVIEAAQEHDYPESPATVWATSGGHTATAEAGRRGGDCKRPQDTRRLGRGRRRGDLAPVRRAAAAE